MLSVPERIAQVAEHFAKHDSHGYSQPHRGSGASESMTLSDGSTVVVTCRDVDCSEMVRQCVNCALTGNQKSPITYMWTGDQNDKLVAQGFTRLSFSASKVRRGDVLWVNGHTGIALGSGMQADAHGDEYGGITGPNAGDQTGHEVEIRSLRTSWTYIYRYEGSHKVGYIDADPVISVKSPCNVRSTPELPKDNSNRTGMLEHGDTIACDRIVSNDDGIWGSYIAYSGKRRYIHIGKKDSWIDLS